MIGVFYGAPVDKKYEQIIKLSINSICEFLGDDVVIIDTKVGNKLRRLLGDHRYVKYTLKDKHNWVDVYEEALGIIRRYNLKKIIYFRNEIVATYKNGNTGLIDAFEDKWSRGQYDHCFSFMLLRSVLHKYVFMKAASHMKCEVYQFFTDVQELAYCDVLQFAKYRKLYLANIKQRQFIFMPTFEYGLLSGEETENEKTIDFVFYCTSLTDDRKYIADQKNYFEGRDDWDCRVIVKGEQKEIISQVSYDRKLSSAKYTLAIPAYDPKHFSIWRIFEALHFNCLCLIYGKCDLTDIKTTYPDLYEICIEYLIVDEFSEIDKKIAELEPIRQDIINKIRSLGTYNKIINLEWCKARWKKMLEV